MMSASEASNKDISGDEDLRAPNFEADAWDIQNRTSCRAGMATAEAWETLWDLLLRDDLLPEGGRPKCLLWALHFLKVGPKQSLGFLAVGMSAGAVDPKTHRKWIWAFVNAIV
jgi:hypothetical protein